MGLIHEKHRLKISCYCPIKILSKAKSTWWYKIFVFSSCSIAKNMPKIAEAKLFSCRIEVVDFRKNCDCGIAELQLRSNISRQSCLIVIAEVLPSSGGIDVIADSKKVAQEIW
jgi:hypothetical protein